ncbi:TPA: PilZ domain-containing protein [Candidatus Poribacteria bacterium]|nr:PilZ domain-containing protein [Candidatus Poribacteria bacterium]
MEIIDEKRRFTRVKTSIPIYYRVLSEAELEGMRELIRLYPSSERARMGLRPTPASSSFRSRELDLAMLQILQEINRKLDAIMDHLGIELRGSWTFSRGRTIDLSGSGVRFTGRTKAERDELLELTLEIPSSGDISLLAKVISVKGGIPPSDQVEMACDFVEINERDREIIVEYCNSLRRGRPPLLPKTPLPKV